MGTSAGTGAGMVGEKVGAWKAPDVVVSKAGGLYRFTPQNMAAEAWLGEHTGGTWFGDSLMVEARYALDLAQGMLDQGWVVR